MFNQELQKVALLQREEIFDQEVFGQLPLQRGQLGQSDGCALGGQAVFKVLLHFG